MAIETTPEVETLQQEDVTTQPQQVDVQQQDLAMASPEETTVQKTEEVTAEIPQPEFAELEFPEPEPEPETTFDGPGKKVKKAVLDAFMEKVDSNPDYTLDEAINDFPDISSNNELFTVLAKYNYTKNNEKLTEEQLAQRLKDKLGYEIEYEAADVGKPSPGGVSAAPSGVSELPSSTKQQPISIDPKTLEAQKQKELSKTGIGKVEPYKYPTGYRNDAATKTVGLDKGLSATLRLFEESQQQYQEGQEIIRKKQSGTGGYIDPSNPSLGMGAQITTDQDRANLQNRKNRAIKYEKEAQPIIAELARAWTGSGNHTNFINYERDKNGEIVDFTLNVKKANAVARKQADALGIKGDFFVRALEREIKAQADYQARLAFAQEEFDKNYLPKLKQKYPEVFSETALLQKFLETKTDDQILQNAQDQVFQESKRVQELQKAEFAPFKADYETQSAAIKDRFAQQTAMFEQEIKNLQIQVDGNAMSLADAQQREALLKEEYQNNQVAANAELNGLWEKLTSIDNKMSTKYNRMLEASVAAIEKTADNELNKAALKFAELRGSDPKIAEEFKAANKRAFEQNPFALRRAIKRTAEESQRTLANTFTESAYSALGGTMSAYGILFGAEWLRVAGDQVVASSTITPGRTEKWTDALDIFNLAKLSGQLVGVMGPSLLATGAASYVTGGIAAPAAVTATLQLATGAVVGWGLNRSEMGARTFNDILNETGSFVKAADASEKMLKFQDGELIYHVFDGLPFGGALKFARLLPKSAIGKGVAIAIPSFIAEDIQEIRETGAEEAIRRNQDPYTVISNIYNGTGRTVLSKIGLYDYGNDEARRRFDLGYYKLAQSVTIATSPLFFGSGASNYASAKTEAYNRDLASKAGLELYQNSLIDDKLDYKSFRQGLSLITLTKGKDFATMMANIMFSNGQIEGREKLNIVLNTINASSELSQSPAVRKMSKEDQAVYVLLADQYQNAVISLEEETDPIQKAAIEKKIGNLKGEMETFANTKSTNVLQMIMANGGVLLFTPNEIEELIDEAPEYAYYLSRGLATIAPLRGEATKAQKTAMEVLTSKVNDYYQGQALIAPLTIDEKSKPVSVDGTEQAAPNIPKFASFTEAKEYIEERMANYASEEAFYSSKEYSDIYTQSKALFDSELEIISAKTPDEALAILESKGFKVGDKVVLNTESNGQPVTYVGTVSLINGVPAVNLDPDTSTNAGEVVVPINDNWTKSGAESTVAAPTTEAAPTTVTAPTITTEAPTETKTQQDAVQEQTAGQVPVQSEAAVSPEVAQGKPKAEPQVATEEGVQAEAEAKPKEELTERERKMAEFLESQKAQEEQKPSETFNISNIDEGIARAKESKDKKLLKILTDAKGVMTALASANPSITIHYNQKTYTQAWSEAGGNEQESVNQGFYISKDGSQIHINATLAESSNLVFHEGAHPVLDWLVQNRPEIIDRLFTELEGFSNILEGVQGAIDFGNNNYTGTQAKKEAIVEFMSRVADGQIKLPPQTTSLFKKIVDFINNLLNSIGIDFGVTITTQDSVVDLARKFTDSVTQGKKLDVKVAEAMEPQAMAATGGTNTKQQILRDIDTIKNQFPDATAQEINNVLLDKGYTQQQINEATLLSGVSAPEVEAAPTGTGKQRVSAIYERMAKKAESEGRTEEAQAIRERGLYFQKKTETSIADAQEIVDQIGAKEAYESFKNDGSIAPDVKGMIYAMYIKELNDAITSSPDMPSQQMVDQRNNVLYELAKYGRSLGRGVNIFKEIYKLMPELFYELEIERVVQESTESLGDPDVVGTNGNTVKKVQRVDLPKFRKNFFEDIGRYFAGEMTYEQFIGDDSKFDNKVKNALKILLSYGKDLSPDKQNQLSSLLRGLSEKGIFGMAETREEILPKLIAEINDVNGKIKFPLTPDQVSEFADSLLIFYEGLAEQKLSDLLVKEFNKNPSDQNLKAAVKAIMYGALETPESTMKFAQMFNLTFLTQQQLGQLRNMAQQMVNARGAVAQQQATVRFQNQMSRFQMQNMSVVQKILSQIGKSFTSTLKIIEAFVYNGALLALNTMNKIIQGNLLRLMERTGFAFVRSLVIGGGIRNITDSYRDLFKSKDVPNEFTYTDSNGVLHTIKMTNKINETVDSVYSSLRGVPRLADVKRSGLSDMEALLRELTPSTSMLDKAKRRAMRATIVPASRLMGALDSITSPTYAAITKRQLYYEIIKKQMPNASAVDISNAVNMIVSPEISVIGKAMEQARMEIINGSLLYKDLGYLPTGEDFPLMVKRYKSLTGKDAKIYNEWIIRVHEILDSDEYTRLKESAHKIGWMSGMTDAEAIETAKAVDDYVSKITSESVFLGTPRGSVGQVIYSLGKVIDGNIAGKIGKIGGLFPLFLNAGGNMVSGAIRITPGLNAIQYVKYRLTGTRGAWTKEQAKRKEFKSKEAVKLDQAQMLYTVILTNTLAAVAYSLRGDDDEEKLKQSIIDKTYTGTTPMKLNPAQEKLGYKPGYIYVNGVPKLDYRDNTFGAFIGFVGYILYGDLWNLNPMSTEIFPENKKETYESLNAEERKFQIGNYLMYVAMVYGEQSTLRELSKTTYELIEAFKPDQTDDEKVKSDKALKKIGERKLANALKLAMPYSRLSGEVKGIYDGLTGRDKKMALDFYDMVFMGTALEDVVIKTNGFDFWGEPVKDSFKLANPLLAGSFTFGESYSEKPEMALYRKNNYSPLLTINESVLVRVKQSDVSGGKLAYEDMLERMRGEIKAGKVDMSMDVDYRENQDPMVTFDVALSAEQSYKKNKASCQFVGEFYKSDNGRNMTMLEKMPKEAFTNCMNDLYRIGKKISIYNMSDELGVPAEDRLITYQAIFRMVEDFKGKYCTPSTYKLTYPVEMEARDYVGENPPIK